MLKSEVGQDLCGCREDMLFRFQTRQDLVIDSVKEKKNCVPSPVPANEGGSC